MGKIKKGKSSVPQKRRIRRWLERMPLRRALVVLTLFFVAMGVALLLLTYLGLSIGYNNIHSATYQRVQDSGMDPTLYIEYGNMVYTPQEQLQRSIYQIIIFISPFVFGFLTSLCTAVAFYRLKLKRPLEVLREGAEKIAQNNLDFHLEAANPDELGALCDSFEIMRGELEKNNRKMWRMMEEHRRLNAAFAHDLRTPLTVLHGYTDFLRTYVPEGKVSEEKLFSTLSTMGLHVERLERYVSDMNRVQSLEDLQPNRESVKAGSFAKALLEDLALLIREKGKTPICVSDPGEEMLFLDKGMVQESAENLAANAVRYAAAEIRVELARKDDFLHLTVSDDGPGFSSEALAQGATAFYRDGKSKAEGHFGLGLDICALLCKKHGGELALQNTETGGARVSASFCVKDDIKRSKSV